MLISTFSQFNRVSHTKINNIHDLINELHVNINVNAGKTNKSFQEFINGILIDYLIEITANPVAIIIYNSLQQNGIKNITIHDVAEEIKNNKSVKRWFYIEYN